MDVVWDGHDMTLLRAPRLASTSTHGTGCTFASAIAANLALGAPLLDAVERAKVYLTEAIRRAPAIGRGHGPVHHLWPVEAAAPRKGA